MIKKFIFILSYIYTITNILQLLIYTSMKPSLLKPRVLALSHHLDTLSNILDKCLRFSLIKIESVSIFPSQATLGSLLLSVVYTFRLKMLLLVLIKNCNSFVYLISILSIKLDLNQETHFTIHYQARKELLSKIRCNKNEKKIYRCYMAFSS